MPNFTIRLQNSPGKNAGESVNSLPPVKAPLEPWASGDTVPSTWTVEVASLADVNKIIDKKLEELTTRIARLEAKLKDSEKTSGERAERAVHSKKMPDSDKVSEENSESAIDLDRKVEPKKSADDKRHEDKHENSASSGSKAESKKHSGEQVRKEAGPDGKSDANKTRDEKSEIEATTKRKSE